MKAVRVTRSVRARLLALIEKRKSVQEVQAWLLENRYGGAASNAEVILKDGEANAARAEFESLAADICDEIVKPRRRS